MTAYATSADLEHSLDQRVVAELCSDTGVPMPGPNPMITHALERGTAIVRSYIRVGGMYGEDDISALVAAKDPLLVMLVVDLASEFLFQRRGMRLSPAIEQRVKQAYSYLEGLREGKMLFGSIAQNAEAGKPIVKAVPLENRAWYAQASASPFFPPRRGDTYP
jgi:hypothetical protein